MCGVWRRKSRAEAYMELNIKRHVREAGLISFQNMDRNPVRLVEEGFHAGKTSLRAHSHKIRRIILVRIINDEFIAALDCKTFPRKHEMLVGRRI